MEVKRRTGDKANALRPQPKHVVPCAVATVSGKDAKGRWIFAQCVGDRVANRNNTKPVQTGDNSIECSYETNRRRKARSGRFQPSDNPQDPARNLLSAPAISEADLERPLRLERLRLSLPIRSQNP
jgi:hypothetical protein